jgi:hypothetical protein
VLLLKELQAQPLLTGLLNPGAEAPLGSKGLGRKKRAADLAAALWMQICTPLFYQTCIEIKEKFGVVDDRFARGNYSSLTISD